MSFKVQIHPSPTSVSGRKKSFDINMYKSMRKDFLFHGYVKRLLKKSLFKWTIFTTITANSLLLALGTNYKMEYKFFNFFNVAEQLFLAIYTVEFIAKMYVDPIKYWRSGFNVFDFIVLLLSYIQRFFLIRNSRVMSWFHIVRPLRILRAISLIRGLQVLFGALVRTLRNVVFVLFLLFLLMTVFALIGYNFYGDAKHGDFENWGSLKSAYFTLFSLVTLDGWTDLRAQTDARGYKSIQLFITGFILLGCFLFFNLFVGVIIINIRVGLSSIFTVPQLKPAREDCYNKLHLHFQETTREFNKGIQAERETTLMEKKQAIIQRQQAHIIDIMDRQKTSQFESFSEMIEKFKQTLRHDDFVMLDDLCSSVSFIDIYLASLDEQDNTLYKLQQLYFEISYVLGNMLQAERKDDPGASTMEMK
ncbi:cation channel sperm-associated protein 3-like isoform X1 [Leucoraja erinacea]|uniref:cation channel sperm-associated protein 3-like isoform X1 n=1 Tax=Leucoraja erinaceus TaxID=7782 RepID=UPI0024577A45|nr:cation channel sperm-associated protein 3-like isoform X1 [Leucoraja erinacea]